MPKATLFDMSGARLGEVELPEEIFGIKPHTASVHAVVKQHLNNRRQGTQSTLTRAEVSGGGAKPWRQKGTGRARQGSTRSPQWTHGGIALGPKPRKYHSSVNKKVRRLAMKSALSAKAASGDIIVIENLNLSEIKTKSFIGFMDAVGISGKKSLVVLPEVRTELIKSARNIPGVRTALAKVMNVYELVMADTFVVDKDALTQIGEVLG